MRDNKFALCVSEADFKELKKRGNVSNYIRTLMFANIEKYEELPPLKQILGSGRNRQIFVTVNPGMKDALVKKGSQYHVTWDEYAKRLSAKAWVDSRQKSISNKSEGDALIKAMSEYKATLGESDVDKDIIEVIGMLSDLINKKNEMNRFKRMIPEIQNLLDKGVSLEDIESVVAVMKESAYSGQSA